MKFYCVSAITGYTTIAGHRGIGKRTIPKKEGLISSREICLAFEKEHLAAGHQVSHVRKWKGGGGTHKKSLSGFHIAERKERTRKMRGKGK